MTNAGQLPVFSDAGVSPPGTSMQAAFFNTAVTAQSCVSSGAIPTSSVSLSLALPALVYIYNDGATAQQCSCTSQNLTITGGAGTTNYVYINKTGTLSQNTTGTPPAGSVLLCTCVVNGGNTALTTITQIMVPFGAGPDSVGGDFAEAASADTLTANLSLRNTLNRVRKAITNLSGGTFAAAVATAQTFMKVDGTNAATPAFPGAISAVGNVSVGGLLKATNASSPTIGSCSNGSAVVAAGGTDIGGEVDWTYTATGGSVSTTSIVVDLVTGLAPKAVVISFGLGTRGLNTTSPSWSAVSLGVGFFSVVINYVTGTSGANTVPIYYKAIY